MTRARVAQVIALATALALPTGASADWGASGAGDNYSKARSLGPGNTPTASVASRRITVSWSPTEGDVPVAGYIVRRYSTGGVEQATGADCAGVATGTSCTETSVPPGTWRYSVTPTRQNWRGAESPQSATVTVAGPALSLSPGTVTSLPTTLAGQITGYAPGQTITFRLDDQTSGQVLSGSITPSPVPASGAADVSVTLPAGVANGSHTIFAIGSGADTASADVSVAVPTTIQTPAFDWRDSSSGTEANQSEQLSFADSRTVNSGSFAPGFSASRYLEFDLNTPLRSTYGTSSVNFNFRYASSNALAEACFYIQVRRASDDTLLGSHGSSGSPVGCANTTATTFTVPLAEVENSAIANDLKIRVYGRGDNLLLGAGFVVDQATVSGSGADGDFTLYPESWETAADGSPSRTVWSLAADDASLFTNSTAWQTTYSASRYLKATFPAYVPSGATVNSATLTHSYRSNTDGLQVCNYVEIYAGATLIGTHGSPASDLSCNSSNATDQTDEIALPEVDTVAEANSLVARVYMKRTTTSTTSRHDVVRLSLEYVK